MCTGPLEDTVFPGRGTVWSSTVVRVALHGFPDVRVLAYVDVDEGPRLLGRVADLDAAPTPGTRVTAVDVDTVPPTFEVLR